MYDYFGVIGITANFHTNPDLKILTTVNKKARYSNFCKRQCFYGNFTLNDFLSFF